jgi:oxazoline/thiazoline dehydrogenase
MSQHFLLSFTKNISLIEQPETERLVLQSSNRSLTFKQARPGLKAALKTLASAGATLVELNQIVQQDDEDFPLLRLYGYVQKFSTLGWLCHSVSAAGQAIATAVPLTSEYQFAYTEVATESKYVLSRFAYCHSVGGQLLLESPLSQAQVQLLDGKGAALFGQLVKPCSCSELIAEVPGLSLETTKQFINLLLSLQMLAEVREDGMTEEQANDTLAQWEFHDLLFQSRSHLFALDTKRL